MKKILLLAVFLICINLAYANLKITEIMYNPSTDENYNEWIEIYNYGGEEIDLSLWKLCNKNILSGYVNNLDSKVYNNESSILLPNEYGIISDGKSGTQVYNNLDVKGKAFHIDSASLCGGLSNSGGSINLTGGENINLVYDNLAKEGYSIEFYNDNWYQSLEVGGTPGKENNVHTNNENIEEKSNSNNQEDKSNNQEVVKENDTTKLEILELSLGQDNKIKFGDIFMIKIKVFKGDTSKYSLSLYAQDKEKNVVSKKTKFNVYDKNQEYTLSLPIQLIPNCNSKYKDGNYVIVLEGLDASNTKEFFIEGINNDLCIKEKQDCKYNYSNQDGNYNKVISEDMEEYNETIYVEDYKEDNSDTYLNRSVNVNYESKDKKLKNLAIYFLIFGLILLSIYLMIQNERTKNKCKSNT